MRSIAEAILQHAETNPDKKAVILQSADYTYGQLAASAKQVAMWLKSIGALPGDRIVVESAHTFEYVSLCYGIHLSRCVFVPLENNTPTERLKDVTEAVSAKYVITCEEHEGYEGSYAVSSIWNDIAAQPIDEFVYNVPEDNDLVEILFTTGTTGKSKGVMVSTRNQVVMGLGGIESIDLKEDNIWLIPTPMNHAAGLRKMHMSMLLGSTVVLLEGFKNMKLLFSMIHEKNATSLYLPPSAIHMLLTFAKKEIAALDGQLRFIYSSSATYPQQDKDAMKALLPHVRMYNIYGGSECGIVCALDFNTDQDREGSIGKPHSYAKITILDENYQPIENSSRENYGFVGVQSESTTLGYWDEPELTASILKNGYLVMSDYGFIDESGSVILIGRANDVINLGGLKVAPAEVEAAVLNVEGVDECLLIPAGRDGMTLKLLVVMKEGLTMDKDAIASYLSKNLEPYKLPKQYVQIEEILKTFNGKVDRKKMIQEYK